MKTENNPKMEAKTQALPMLKEFSNELSIQINRVEKFRIQLEEALNIIRNTNFPSNSDVKDVDFGPRGNGDLEADLFNSLYRLTDENNNLDCLMRKLQDIV